MTCTWVTTCNDINVSEIYAGGRLVAGGVLGQKIEVYDLHLPENELRYCPIFALCSHPFLIVSNF